jgi:hypothetical protein
MADITYSKPTWVNGSSVKLNATNMQAISDAVDGVCHLANRGGAILDADTVSGYGIGTTAPIADPGGLTKGGLTSDTASYGTDSPYPSITYAGIVTIPHDATNIAQFAIPQDVLSGGSSQGLKYRSTSDGGSTWTTWKRVWTELNDGNGGQPPAPKPTLTGGLLGSVIPINTTATGNTYPNGTQVAGSAGDNFLVCGVTYTTPGMLLVGTRFTIDAGNNPIVNLSAGQAFNGMSWRVS